MQKSFSVMAQQISEVCLHPKGFGFPFCFKFGNWPFLQKQLLLLLFINPEEAAAV